MISATWSVDFQMVLFFYTSLSSFYLVSSLFSIRQLRELLAEM